MKEVKNIPLHESTDPAHPMRVEAVTARPVREGEAAQTATAASANRPGSDPNKSSYAGYLFGGSGTEDRPAWSDTSRGRAVIRLFSRGVVGAAFFVAGGHIAKKQLEGYESWDKIGPMTHKNFLRHIAKGWDLSVGRAIEKITYTVTPGSAAERAAAAWEVTNFRTKTFSGAANALKTTKDRWGFERTLNGRSLGSEIVTVTFDFFMASIGDAMTRNIIQAFDPNVKQPWLLDTQGHATTRDKGKFDAGRWAQSLGRSSWRILTKNAGEDWAAALPYVYQMKFQRQVLAKAFPGFKLGSDHGMNGGVARIATADHPSRGVFKGMVTGDYQLPGLLDLQVRFTGYNWYTLMYREMYDSIGRSLDKWKHGDLHLAMPGHGSLLMAPIDGAGFLARYITKSFIKANLYMTTAVIPFWMFRTPQSAAGGGYVSDELATARDGMMESAWITKNPHKLAMREHNNNPAFVEHFKSDLFPRYQSIHGPQRPDVAYFGNGHVLRRSEMKPGAPNLFTIKHPYEAGLPRSIMGHILNPFGWMCYKSGNLLTRAVDAIAPNGDALSRYMHGIKAERVLSDPRVKQGLLASREGTIRDFVNASFSYTPYMWAKAETALRVDDRRSIEELGHMDKAIYRLIDNTFSFRFGEAWKAARDVGKLAIHFEKDVKSREGVGVGYQPVGDGTVIPRLPDLPPPATRIDTGTIRHAGRQKHDPVTLDREDSQRNWAESVAGRKLDAQFQTPGHTLH